MATSKSTMRATKRLAAKLPKGMTPQQLKDLSGDSDDEMVSIPFIPQPYKKAPAVDPHLRPETVSKEIVKFGEVELPPVLSGIQPGLDLQGNPKDYRVRVIWASREQIDRVLKEIEHQQPEPAAVLEVVRSFMCEMDSIRNEASFGVSVARGWFEKKDGPDVNMALDCLQKVSGMFGRWRDERRLHLH